MKNVMTSFHVSYHGFNDHSSKWQDLGFSHCKPLYKPTMQLDEIVSLINTLYAPNQDKTVFGNVQRQLQEIQKQENAHIIAHELLQYNSQTVQYFGALTYTVYILNNSIDDKFAILICDEIVDSCRRNLDLMVIKKLISNLSKIFTKIYYNALNYMLDKLLSELDNIKLTYKIGLLSSAIFAEELNKTEDITTEQNNIIIDSIMDVTTKHVLINSMSLLMEDNEIRTFWLDCLQSWIYYLSRAKLDFQKNSDLNECYALAVELLLKFNDINSLNLFVEIYDICPSLLNFDNKLLIDNLIFSDWTNNFISSNDLDDNSKLSKLIALILDSDMIHLATKLIDPTYDSKFEYLLFLTNQPGDPILEETFSVDLLEFWLLFVEAFINDTDAINSLLNYNELELKQLEDRSKKYFLQLSTSYWNKSRFIQDLEDIEDEFNSFRRDVSELFESLFSISRNEIYYNLTSSITNTLQSTSFENFNDKELNDIDTSIYLLTAISDILGENQSDEHIYLTLKSLFDFNFLSQISYLITKDSLTKKYCQYTVKHTINFLSSINWFYKTEYGQKFLKDILVFLFQYLNTQNFQESSSKAILLIIDGCRDGLVDVLDDFEIAAISMIETKLDLEINARSRILRSYASILQTVDNLDFISEKISKFLDLIYHESVNAYNNINPNKDNAEILENISNFLLSMISSVIGLAKGMENPEDWDLYYDGKEDKINEVYKYWKFEDSTKCAVNEKYYKLILLYSFPNDILPNLQINKNLEFAMVEYISELFKIGLMEPLPGPFVLSYDTTINYIIKCCQYCQINKVPKSHNSPMIKLMEIYGNVIKSNYTALTISKSTNLPLATEDLRLNQVLNEILFKQFNEVVNDIDLLQYLFQLFTEILGRFPTLLIKNEGFIKILEISTDQLFKSNQERFVISSLTKMLETLILMKRGKLEDIEYLNNILVNGSYGSYLTYSLFKGFINTPRSQINFYGDVLKSLVSKYGRYLSEWILESFNKIKIEMGNGNKHFVDASVIKLFTKKLLLTRGNNSANKIIKEFWFAVTGLEDYGTL